MRTAAAGVLALAAAADAFTGIPAGSLPQAALKSKASATSVSMTMSPPEPKVALPINLAKKNALDANKKQWGINGPIKMERAANLAKTRTLQRNKEQWGITEALKVDKKNLEASFAAPDAAPAAGGAPAAPAAPAASGGIAQNKAKANTLSRNKEQWGITEALTGSPDAPAAPAAPAASGGIAQNKAKANTLSRNKEQWGITEALKGSPDAPAAPAAPAVTAVAAPVAPTVPAYRKVTNDEVRALMSKFEGKSDAEIVSGLSTYGYTGGLATNVAAAIKAAKTGGFNLEEHEKVLEEVASIEAKAKASMAKAVKLEGDAEAAERKIADVCEAGIRGLNTKLEAAQAEVAQWGWVPFNTAKDDVARIQAEIANMKKQAEELNMEAKECVAGAAAMRAAHANEMESAGAKRAEAASIKAKTVGAKEQGAIDALAAKLAEWEKMPAGGAVSAIESAETKELLFTLGLVPSSKAGINSLSGRLDALLNPPAPKGKAVVSKAKTASGSSVAGGDQGDSMSRKGFLALLGAALLGGGGWFANEKGLLNGAKAPQPSKAAAPQAPKPPQAAAPQAAAPQAAAPQAAAPQGVPPQGAAPAASQPPQAGPK